MFAQPLKDFIHLFFPRYCIGCGTDEMQSTQLICTHCHSQLPETGFLSSPNNPVEKKFYGRLNVQEAGSAFYYTKDSIVQKLVFELKYKGNKNAGIFFGKMLGEYVLRSGRFTSIDCIVPLPLNKKREKERGYNQALLIANSMATILKKPVTTSAIIRNAYTKTQTHKNRVLRWETMQNVFSINDEASISGKHILLIDDVLTTGATLEVCGNAVLQIPGTRVSVATVAVAML